ncbi:MAG: T9SS type A sorting domain-containing protein [Saprospiraceae bacterium]|nr:T9SS type A sorting domain-containing protein [Saprospiraceae bacterium]
MGSVSFSVLGQPTGIYVLDSNQGTYRDANIRNYSFVTGFTWRTSWANFETSQGVYDYTSLDHIVHRLDSINKKLTVLFGASSIEPAYIITQSGVTTYQFTDPVSNLTSTRPVPYDGYLLQRFRLFLSSLANHQIYSLSSGTMVAFKDHPVLANIATNIPGLGAIRNVNGFNTSLESALPNYTRSKFVDSLLVSMKVQTDNFPAKYVFIPFYANTNDNIASPSLEDYIKSQLLANFNGVINPKIGFWQENLAGFTDTNTNIFTGLPTTTFATPLYQLGNSAYVMFQMLQGWTTPFLDPTKTANSTPFDAMCYAFNTYNSSYYEIYVSDIDNPIYQQSFINWDANNCGPVLSLDYPLNKANLKIYPNPASNSISISGIDYLYDLSVLIFNSKGQNIMITQNYQNIDVSTFNSGIYFICINQNDRKYYFKLIKQ